jgi:hypothetical protein
MSRVRFAAVSLLATVLAAAPGGAQTPLDTAFSYQGRLTDAGNPANGPYDLQLVLFDAPSGGAQVGPTLSRDDVAVANGLFTVTLDFGASFAGSKRWLELRVRPGVSTGSYTTLGPRQELTPSPNAAFSLATPWTGIGGKPPGFADDVDNDALGALSCPNGQIAKRAAGVWACGDDLNSGGDITDVVAGTGLTGGGTTGSVTVSASLAGSGSASTIARSDHDHFSQSWSGSTANGLTVTNGGGAALRGLSTSTGAVPGVFGSAQSSVGIGVHGQALATSGATRGVFGEASSSDGAGLWGTNTAAQGSGVMGRATGGGYGVMGIATSLGGAAVAGIHQSTVAASNIGVLGNTLGPGGWGVYAQSQATSGPGVGVYARANSSAGTGGLFENSAGGPAIIMSGGGLIFSDGTTQTTAAVSNPGDITGVIAGTGLTGGGTAGDVTLGVSFGGNGAASSVSRSDHNHAGQSWSTSAGGVQALRVSNTGSGGFSDGIWGQGDAAGGGRGVVGYAPAATGANVGVWGQADSSAGRGVFGYAPAGNGTTYGVYGQSASPIGLGVYGLATSTSGITYGVQGETVSPIGYGVFGFASGVASASTYGLFGQSNAANDGRGVGGRGVFGIYGIGSRAGSYGIDQFASNSSVGLWGQSVSTASGAGVFAQSLGTTGGAFGIYADAAAAGSWAGYFVGRVNVTGTLSKGGGSFKIDHPLDPEHRYLYHSFVESPDMKNIYDGNVLTDEAGLATVELPDWFEALNRDFRYQLTVIGQFAQAIVARKIAGNRFTIRTDKPAVEVSWQVTGIRKDAFAEKYRIPVEEDKAGDEVGTYLYPEAYGLSRERALDTRRRPMADQSQPPAPPSPTEH